MSSIWQRCGVAVQISNRVLVFLKKKTNWRVYTTLINFNMIILQKSNRVVYTISVTSLFKEYRIGGFNYSRLCVEHLRDLFEVSISFWKIYGRSDLNANKRFFNYRLSRARRTIKNAFGILMQRWRVFRKPIIADISTCENVVKATVVLHNFLMCDREAVKSYSSITDRSNTHPTWSNNPKRVDKQARDYLALSL